VDSPTPNSDEQFAEWYVWAKREVSTDSRVCLGAAQAGITALESGADLQSARMAARRSVAGYGIGLVENVVPRRRAYAEWYDWSRREIGGGIERQHEATRVALAALDGGADAAAAAAAARREVGLETAPRQDLPSAPANAPSAALTAEHLLPPPAAPLTGTPPSVTPPAQPPSAAPPPASPSAAAPPSGPPPTSVPGPTASMAAGAPPSHGLASYPAHAPVPAPAPSHAYAGFWRRFAAALIDTAMLLVGTFILIVLVEFFVVLGLVSSGQQLTDESYVGSLLVVSGILIVLVWLYYAGLESSAWQATIGKRLMHVVVTDLYGRRISFGRATGRYWSKILSALMLFAGFWVIPLTQRKQGLHDLIASTLVGRRDYVALLMPAAPLQPAHPQNRPGGASEVQGA